MTRLHLVQDTRGRRERRDTLGRRIGYNWWREFIWGEWRCAYDAWLLSMQDHCLGYGTEEREHRYNNPSPKFKDFLIAHAGQHRRSSEALQEPAA